MSTLSTQDTVQYIIRDGSFIRQSIRNENLGPQAAILSALQTETFYSTDVATIETSYSFHIRDPDGQIKWVTEKFKENLGIISFPNAIATITRMPYLTVTGNFIIYKFPGHPNSEKYPAVLTERHLVAYLRENYPSVRVPSGQEGLRLRLRANFEPIMIVLWTNDPISGTEYPSIYLLHKPKDSKQMLAIPMPNIYESNGSVCLGNNLDDVTPHDKINAHLKVLSHIQEEDWSEDLGSYMCAAHGIWEGDTFSHAPLPVNQRPATHRIVLPAAQWAEKESAQPQKIGRARIEKVEIPGLGSGVIEKC